MPPSNNEPTIHLQVSEAQLGLIFNAVKAYRHNRKYRELNDYLTRRVEESGKERNRKARREPGTMKAAATVQLSMKAPCLAGQHCGTAG